MKRTNRAIAALLMILVFGACGVADTTETSTFSGTGSTSGSQMASSFSTRVAPRSW